MQIKTEAILELVAQRGLAAETAVRLIRAKDQEREVVQLVAENKLNAVAATFLLEADEMKAGVILLEVCKAIEEMNHPKAKAANPQPKKTYVGPRAKAQQQDVLNDPNIAAISATKAADLLGISKNTASFNYRQNGFLLPNVPVLSVGRRRIVSTFHLREALGLPHPSLKEAVDA